MIKVFDLRGDERDYSRDVLKMQENILDAAMDYAGEESTYQEVYTVYEMMHLSMTGKRWEP